nr:beta-glucosidase BoGH3B-like [Ipomoea batatas]
MGKDSRFLIGIGVALLCCWIVGANADYMLYKDHRQAVGRRIKDLMSRMTLEEKIGQMVQIERQVASAEVMKKYYIGSVLSSGGSVPKQKASAEAWVDMVNDFQKGSLSTRLGIPMIYGIDAVHGNNNAYNATIFPHNVGLGATRDPELVREIGAATALEVRATGIQYVFAPCIAVCRDPRWGRCYESYSEDPEIVRSMTEIIPGLQGEAPPNYPLSVPFVAGRKKVAACAKHYVGDGGTVKGIDENNTLVDMHDLFSIHMAGTTILTAIKNTVDTKTQVTFEENPDPEFVKSSKFSHAIVVVGEKTYAEGSGDSLNLTIPDPGPSIITNVCAHTKCVVVLITGRPVVIQPYLPQIDALVAAWLPGTEGQGVADVLFGDYGFTGKLPFTWFKTVDQLPMNVGDPHYDPLFPFGHGLFTKPTK